MQLKFGNRLLAFCSNICDSFFLSQNRKRIQSDPYLYDAFVSYSSEDEAWVRDELVGGKPGPCSSVGRESFKGTSLLQLYHEFDSQSRQWS